MLCKMDKISYLLSLDKSLELTKIILRSRIEVKEIFIIYILMLFFNIFRSYPFDTKILNILKYTNISVRNFKS